MTPEELQKEVERLKNENEKLTKDLDDATRPSKIEEPKKETLSLEEQEARNREEKLRIDEHNAKVESAAKFNYEIDNFVSDNLAVIGDEVKSIIDLSKERTYPNSIEKANELRASILNKYFSKKENVEALLTESFKKKAIDFLGLTQVKKHELAGQHWELFELSVQNKMKDKKQEELLKKENGQEVTDVQKNLKEKIGKKSQEYYFQNKK